VVAPYACLLAASLRPHEVIANLEHLAHEGALGPLGYYEAIDYTKNGSIPASTARLSEPTWRTIRG
jgi:cyclic beta-1,2-glucan synthetase